MPTTTMIHVRVDDQLKAQATEALAAMGLTVSDAVRVFLTRIVADKRLPFDLRLPNAGRLPAIEQARAMAEIRRAAAEALIEGLRKARRA